jgi:CobQ-like glutamine amidotransferase family enzyme
MNKIMEQLNMIGRKVDIITEGYTKDQIEQNIEHFIDDEKEILSSCCGYEPMGELHYDNESKEVEMVGLCSKCKDHADFEEV